MNYLLFLIVFSILIYSLSKKPGIFIAYILLFQSLNLALFELVGIPQFRYVVTIILVPLYFIVHRNDISIAKSYANSKSKMTSGFIILGIYIILYALVIGTKYEYKYISMFMFPTFMLFVLARISFFKEEQIRELFWGIIIFTVITLFYLILFNRDVFNIMLTITRKEFTEEIGFGGAIGHARMAAIFIIYLILLILNGENKKLLVINLLLLVVAFYWLSMTGTRGPLVAMILVILFYIIFSKGKIKHLNRLVIISIILIVALLYIGIQESLLFNRTEDMLSFGGFYSMQRYKRWVIFIDIIWDNILFGLGPGGWSKHVWGGEYRYPHNMFMEYTIEFGLVGLVTFLMIVITGIKACINIIKNNNNIFIISISMGWLFYLINLMFSSSLLQGSLNFYIYTVLLSSLIKNDTKNVLS